LLFSPEALLREEAARAIARKGNDIYKSVSERIPTQTREDIGKIVSGDKPDCEFTFEKVRFLSSWLTGMNEEDLLIPAANLNYFNDITNSGLKQGDGCILWSLRPTESVEIINDYTDGFNGLNSKIEGHYCCLQFDSVEDYISKFPEKAEVILRFIGEKEK